MSPERDCIQGGLTPSGEGLARGQRPDRFDTEELPKCSTRHDLVNLWETGWAGLRPSTRTPGQFVLSLCAAWESGRESRTNGSLPYARELITKPYVQ